MTKYKALSVAEKLFPNYPKAENFYITSDGFSFLRDTDAQAHAKKLKDNTVISISRADVEAEKVKAKDGAEKEADKKEAAAKVPAAKKAAEKAAADKKAAEKEAVDKKAADANTQTSKTDN